MTRCLVGTCGYYFKQSWGSSGVEYIIQFVAWDQLKLLWIWLPKKLNLWQSKTFSVLNLNGIILVLNKFNISRAEVGTLRHTGQVDFLELIANYCLTIKLHLELRGLKSLNVDPERLCKSGLQVTLPLDAKILTRDGAWAFESECLFKRFKVYGRVNLGVIARKMIVRRKVIQRCLEISCLIVSC